MKRQLFSAGLVLALTLGLSPSAWAKCQKCPVQERPVACPVQCPVQREVSCPTCPERRHCNINQVKPCPVQRCPGECPTGSNISTDCPPLMTGNAGVTAYRYEHGTKTTFKVVNPTNSSVQFRIASVGINETIPAHSERTFFLNMDNVASPAVAYTLECSTGQVLASGSVPNEMFASMSSMLATDLSHIINYSTAYSYPLDPEPEYRERPAAYQPSRPVRGYW